MNPSVLLCHSNAGLLLNSAQASASPRPPASSTRWLPGSQGLEDEVLEEPVGAVVPEVDVAVARRRRQLLGHQVGQALQVPTGSG